MGTAGAFRMVMGVTISAMEAERIEESSVLLTGQAPSSRCARTANPGDSGERAQGFPSRATERGSQGGRVEPAVFPRRAGIASRQRRNRMRVSREMGIGLAGVALRAGGGGWDWQDGRFATRCSQRARSSPTGSRSPSLLAASTTRGTSSMGPPSARMRVRRLPPQCRSEGGRVRCDASGERVGGREGHGDGADRRRGAVARDRGGWVNTV